MSHGLKIGEVFYHRDLDYYIVVGEDRAAPLLYDDTHTYGISPTPITVIELDEALRRLGFNEIPKWIRKYNDCIIFESEYI